MDDVNVHATDQKGDKHAADHGAPLSFGRKLPRAVQLLLLAIGAALVGTAVVFVLLPAASPEKAAEQPAAPATDGAVQLTGQQWAGMRVVPIKTMTFVISQETDGSIAIDDDLVTQVFSPYSGRVTKLFS
jgi:cobalt-zinc-cadmium efflux system membrane fusion protein